MAACRKGALACPSRFICAPKQCLFLPGWVQLLITGVVGPSIGFHGNMRQSIWYPINKARLIGLFWNYFAVSTQEDAPPAFSHRLLVWSRQGRAVPGGSGLPGKERGLAKASIRKSPVLSTSKPRVGSWRPRSWALVPACPSTRDTCLSPPTPSCQPVIRDALSYCGACRLRNKLSGTGGGETQARSVSGLQN